MNRSTPLFQEPEFERTVSFEAAWDRRHDDPSKNYGVYGVEILFLLKGPLGATQFRLSTGWLLPETVGCRPDPSLLGIRHHDYTDGLSARGAGSLYPMPVDLGYHSPQPMYEGHDPMTDECPYIGGQCYYDGSGLNAWRPFEALLREGHEGVWNVLGGYYLDLFKPVTADV